MDTPATSTARLDLRPGVTARVDLVEVGTMVLLAIGVFVGYVAGSYVAFQLLSTGESGAVFFAPAGITSAALLLTSKRRWPAVLLAAFAAELFMDVRIGGIHPRSLLGFATANTVEPLIGAVIAVRVRDRLDLARLPDLVWFMLGPVLAGPFIGGLLGGATVWLSGGAFISSALTWWLGDGLGVLIVGAIALNVPRTAGDRGMRSLECWGLLVITAGVAGVLHVLTDLPMGFLSIIPVVVVSARFGVVASTIASATVAVIAVWSWISADGVVAGMPSGTGMMLEKLQLAAMAAAGLLVAAEASEREHASERAVREVETAQMLRQVLAPLPFIRSVHADAEGISRSSSDRLSVGGDWYDITESASGVVAIMIGDVVGHGEDAVVSMGKLRFAASAFAMLARDSGEMLDWLDAYVRQTGERHYATAFFALFDPNRRELTYSTAGHPPALLHGDGTWRWLSDGRSTPIGVPFPRPRPSVTVPITGPSTLVVYTDGVVERAGEVIDTGLARMFDAVVSAPDDPVEDLLQRLLPSAASDDASFVRIQLRC